MINNDTDELLVIVDSSSNEVEIDGTKGWREIVKGHSSEASGNKAVFVSSQRLEQEMSLFLAMVEKIFSQAKTNAEDSQILLEEIQLSVELSAEGKVMLVGTGITAGSKGSITMKFKRNHLD